MPLKKKEYQTYLKIVGNWTVVEGKKIQKQFIFKNFIKAIAFINKIAAIAEAEGHHPDIRLFSWNKVEITLYTHAINGLHVNDFILAAKINKL